MSTKKETTSVAHHNATIAVAKGAAQTPSSLKDGKYKEITIDPVPRKGQPIKTTKGTVFSGDHCMCSDGSVLDCFAMAKIIAKYEPNEDGTVTIPARIDFTVSRNDPKDYYGIVEYDKISFDKKKDSTITLTITDAKIA